MFFFISSKTPFRKDFVYSPVLLFPESCSYFTNKLLVFQPHKVYYVPLQIIVFGVNKGFFVRF